MRRVGFHGNNSDAVVIGALMLLVPGLLFTNAMHDIISEMMARIRKFPTIAYLVVSIFPMIPGAGVYYTMNYIVQGEMSLVAEQGLYTIAIAGLMAVAILMVSSVVRLCFYDRMKRGG